MINKKYQQNKMKKEKKWSVGQYIGNGFKTLFFIFFIVLLSPIWAPLYLIGFLARKLGYELIDDDN